MKLKFLDKKIFIRILSIAKSIEKGFAWSFLGVIITVAFFIITEYNNRFNLELKINDDVKLVEVREQIPDLNIFYKEKELINSNQEIRIITLTLKNSGQDIIQAYYDNNQPFGLTFESSSILGFNILDSNSDYLKQNLLPRIESVDKLYFSKVIFERNKYIMLKVYLLQPKGISQTKISLLGKIAGIDKVPITYPGSSLDNNEFSTPSSPIPWQLLAILCFFSGALITFLISRILMRKFNNSSIMERHFLEERKFFLEKIKELEYELTSKGGKYRS